MEEALNFVKWNGAALSVNLARFDKNHKPINYNHQPPNPKPIQPRASHPIPGQAHGRTHMKPGPGFSYRDAVTGAANFQAKTIEIDSDFLPYPNQCLGRSIIAIARDLSSLVSLRLMLNNSDNVAHKEAAISYVGGLSTLIVFRNKEIALDFLDRKSLWGLSFLEASLWNGQPTPFSRIARLSFTGVPYPVRDYTTYNQLGGLFGKVISGSDFSWASIDNSQGSCFILTDSVKRIDEEIFIKWRNLRHRVWVAEDISPWNPSFLNENATSNQTTSSSGNVDLEDGEIRQESNGQVSGNSKGRLPGKVFSRVHGKCERICESSNIPLNDAGPHVDNNSNNNNNNHNVLGNLGFNVGSNSGSPPFAAQRSRKRPRGLRSPPPTSPTFSSSQFNFHAHSSSSSLPDLNNPNPVSGFKSQSNNTEVPLDEPSRVNSPDNLTTQMSMEAEINEIIHVGACLGIDLESHRDQVRTEINGAGSTSSNP